jgi:hypothetical protein
MRRRAGVVLLVGIIVLGASTVVAQQKGQWVPGQAGLNAGVLPEPGFTYANLTLNYSADTLRDQDGNSVPVTGNYSFWVVENIVYYVPKAKFLGAKLAFMAVLPAANGSLTLPQFGVAAGGYGFADTYVQPLTLGWSTKRADFWLGYAFVAPTGRYTPGASDNVGSGYWGNDFVSGTTLYLTKNKGTSLNLATAWEFHGEREAETLLGQPTRITPGQTFTTEWGLGQVLPLDKQMHKLLQVGVIGYDQWQVSDNGGSLVAGIPASILPHYSVHAVGLQTNFIVPQKDLNFFFKYLPEYSAKAHPQGRTFVFGGSWTWRVPKPPANP